MYLHSKKMPEYTIFLCVNCVCVCVCVLVCVCVVGMYVCTHIHYACTHLCVILYECAIMCVYARLYCMCTDCMLYLCLFVLVCFYCNRFITLQRQHSGLVVSLSRIKSHSPLVLWCFHVSCSVAAFTRDEPACTNRLVSIDSLR